MPDRRAPTHTSAPPGIQQSAVERVLKRVLAVTIVVALALYFGVTAIAVTLRYVIVPHIDRFRPRIEALATKALSTPVKIDRLSARWQSLAPEFTIDGLQIQGPNGKAALRVDHASGVIAWRSLLRLKPIFSTSTNSRRAAPVTRQKPISPRPTSVTILPRKRLSGRNSRWTSQLPGSMTHPRKSPLTRYTRRGLPSIMHFQPGL